MATIQAVLVQSAQSNRLLLVGLRCLRSWQGVRAVVGFKYRDFRFPTDGIRAEARSISRIRWQEAAVQSVLLADMMSCKICAAATPTRSVFSFSYNNKEDQT